MSQFMFSIGDVARLTGITPKTIRHYHEVGLLADPLRDANNYRLYSIDQLEQLQHILRLKRFGLSLQQIKTVLEASDPDALIRLVLEKRQQRIEDEIQSLQHQLSEIDAYLTADSPQLPETPQSTSDHAAMDILSDAIKPRANGVSDLLVAFEGQVLAQLDNYNWTDGYDLFWHQIGQFLVPHLTRHESHIIFWLERYLALAEMDDDDLQGQAWIAEIKGSQTRLLLSRLFRPPPIPLFDEKEQESIHKLVPALLYEEGNPLQKAFLQALIAKS